VIDRGRLVLDASLDVIRRDHRRVQAGFAGEPPPWRWQGAEGGSVRVDGRQITIMAHRDADAVIERAYSLGAVTVESSAVSLREVFLDAVADPR
jgi:hypothetical protein